MGAVYSLLKIINNERGKKKKKNYCKSSSRFPNIVLSDLVLMCSFSLLQHMTLYVIFTWSGLFFPYVTVIVLSIVHSAVVVVQLLSRVQLFVTPWTAVTLCFPVLHISQSLLKFMSIELVMLSNHLTLCCPLLLLPSIFPSIKVYSNELTLSIR